MRFNFKKIFGFLNPSPEISGLEISDNALRFLTLKNNQVKKQASVNLPAGTLDGGKVVNEKNLIDALRNLRSQIGRGKRGLPVVVSLSSANIYTQIFNLPHLETTHLEEAAKLNLQMISPLKRESVYNDWQIVGETAGGNHEALGAFIDATLVDQLMALLKKTGFFVIALEFLPLSLTRFIKEQSQLDLTIPYLAINVGGEGLNFFVIYEGNLHFDHFISWRLISEKDQATSEAFKKVVTSELKKILNSYGNRWHAPLTNVLLISSQPTKEIVEWLQREFSLKVQVLDRHQDLDSNWFVAMGAALRGLINRADDLFISLTRVGTEEEFLRSRIWRFASIWRTSIILTMIAVIALFTALDWVLIRMNKQLLAELGGTRVPVNQQETTNLETEAKSFNVLIERALAARKQALRWSSFLAKINNLAGSQINIAQLDFNPSTGLVSLAGNSKNEQLILVFKNALIKEPNFFEVNLPLSAIIPTTGGVSLFATTFKVKLP